MATLTATVVAAADDGCVSYSALSTGTPVLGTNYGDTAARTYFRFAGVAIPNGSTISAATLTLTKGFADTGSLSVKFQGAAVDSYAQPATATALTGQALTTAASATLTSTSAAWNTGGTVQVNVLSVVQEIIGRTGWASGNALGVIAVNVATSGNGYFEVANQTATLALTYTASGSSFSGSLARTGSGALTRSGTGSGTAGQSGSGTLARTGSHTLGLTGTAAFISGGGGGGTARPFADLADWLWNPIKPNPTLDAKSSTMVTAIWQGGARSTAASLHDFGVVIIDSTQITSSTNPTRFDVPLAHESGTADPWGANPFGSGAYLPVAASTKLPPYHTVWDGTGENYGDCHYAVLDPIDNKIKSIWQLQRQSSTSYTGSWGGVADLHGDGRETAGTSTAAGFARPAGVVRIQELANAAAANTGLSHALFMSIDQTSSAVRFPAKFSDGSSGAVPMGTRFQLDPTINVDAIAGITAAEKVIAKTLQTHGAYIGDSSGGACNIIFEFDQGSSDGTANNPTTNIGATYKSLGLTADYQALSKIPWTKMRALATDESGTSSAPNAAGAISRLGSHNLTFTGKASVGGKFARTGGSLLGGGVVYGDTFIRTGFGLLTRSGVASRAALGSVTLRGRGALGVAGAGVQAGRGTGAVSLLSRHTLALDGVAWFPAWVFSPPTQTVPYQITGRLWGSYEQGLTVYRSGGEWFTAATPTAEQLASADRIYAGGRLHVCTEDERLELWQAGFGPALTGPTPGDDGDGSDSGGVVTDQQVFPGPDLYPDPQLFPYDSEIA